jgi:hypothetical protein
MFGEYLHVIFKDDAIGANHYLPLQEIKPSIEDCFIYLLPTTFGPL